jgi:hypothetical protein
MASKAIASTTGIHSAPNYSFSMGERAATIRMRETGKICCLCHAFLPPPAPDRKPGWRTGERYCAKCIPRPHAITCNVMASDWAVHFIDTDYRTRIGPWLLCDSADEVVRVLEGAQMSADQLAAHHRNVARWGVGGGTLHLSSRERDQLIARGQGWPWTGYELRKMKEAGRYPPNRRPMMRE